MPRVCVGGAACIWMASAAEVLLALLAAGLLLLLMVVAAEMVLLGKLFTLVGVCGGLLKALLGPPCMIGGGVGRPVLTLAADPIRYSGLSTLAGTPIRSMYPGTDGA